MAELINLTIDGRAVRVPPQTLVIDAAKTVGIEIPAFCYYEGLSLAAACRMCLVEVEKMPKMMTACTLPVSEGMVVRTETDQVKQSRRDERDRSQRGRSPGVRRVRRLHRYLPRGRAHQRYLPLPDPPLGDDPHRHHLHALRRWLQDHAGHAQRQDPARQQPRPLWHQRRVPVHQGTLRLRFLRSPRAPANSA